MATAVRTTHRRNNHSDYYSQRVGHQIIITEHVKDYRAAVTNLVRSDDLALEIGCAGGETTRILGAVARLTYGVDKTIVQKNLEEQQRNANSTTRFVTADSNDIGTLIKLSNEAATEAQGPHEGFSVILIDISGNATFSNLLTLLERYEGAGVFGKSLRVVIIKSFRFANLMDRTRVFEPAAPQAPAVKRSNNRAYARALPWLVAAFGLGALLGSRLGR